MLVELDKRDEALAVQLGRVRLTDAERLYNRYQKSGSTGAVLPTEMDAASTALESIRIELQRAQVALDDRLGRVWRARHCRRHHALPDARAVPATGALLQNARRRNQPPAG